MIEYKAEIFLLILHLANLNIYCLETFLTRPLRLNGKDKRIASDAYPSGTQDTPSTTSHKAFSA